MVSPYLMVIKSLGLFQGIDINLRYGKPVFDGNKITWTIPPYSEINCLLKLKEVFGKNG